MARKETGRDYELIVKAIYEALWRQERIEEWKVWQNVKLSGKTAEHQIDVYCKFRAAGEEHQVIIEVKKEKRRAEKGDLFKLAFSLEDIPGQPRGIFVNRASYQSGAKRFAKKVGIVILQLMEVKNPPPMEIPLLSVARFTMLPKTLAFRWVLKKPVIVGTSFAIDRGWMEQYGKHSNLAQIRWFFHGVRFCDEDGNVVGVLREEIQKRLHDASGGERIEVNLEFPKGVFMEGFKFEEPPDFSPERIKIKRLSVTLDVEETTSIRPFRSEQYTTYELKRILEEDGHYILVTADEAEPQAIVGLLLSKTEKRMEQKEPSHVRDN